jgi:hypothetical protein
MKLINNDAIRIVYYSTFCASRVDEPEQWLLSIITDVSRAIEYVADYYEKILVG